MVVSPCWKLKGKTFLLVCGRLLCRVEKDWAPVSLVGLLQGKLEAGICLGLLSLVFRRWFLYLPDVIPWMCVERFVLRHCLSFI